MSEDKDVVSSVDLTVSSVVRGDTGLRVNEPLYPILKINELPRTADLKAQLPREVSKYLGPQMEVVHIHQPELIWPARKVSAIEVCMKAARARHANEIGYNGPTVASVNLQDK